MTGILLALNQYPTTRQAHSTYTALTRTMASNLGLEPVCPFAKFRYRGYTWLPIRICIGNSIADVHANR